MDVMELLTKQDNQCDVYYATLNILENRYTIYFYISLIIIIILSIILIILIIYICNNKTKSFSQT